MPEGVEEGIIRGMYKLSTMDAPAGKDKLHVQLFGSGAILRARREAFEPLVDQQISETARWLDVSLLAVALREILGIDAAALAAGGRLTYTQDAAEAVARVERGEGVSAFLERRPPRWSGR